ncbi:heat shock factor protein 5 isoform X2 [Accipiter gentilis]|uniref:heat shock factor protein 5 isoform X2 n=1 Tax=Astur gentilis TaxID=8957 RepID=UPI00210F2893|nr:heat shock factor protein 5 isoform X2 [Accipiter gentilis]
MPGLRGRTGAEGMGGPAPARRAARREPGTCRAARGPARALGGGPRAAAVRTRADSASFRFRALQIPRPSLPAGMEEPRLSAPINPNNFPAKLWQLVNSPHYRSICWDARGEGLLIDQQLFESELLGAGLSCSTAPADDGTAGAADFFKTKNFTSFIRQLNLYGFRKVMMGPVGSVVGPGPGPGLGAGTGDGGASTGPLHHFHSPNFRRDRPDLLIHLKRLTRTNKAKLAAGLEVTSRPPNRFQRVLGTSLHMDPLLPPSTLGKAKRPGLLTVGQFHQPYPQDSFRPYSYISTSSQNNGTLPTKSLAWTPVPSRTWQGSLGLLPGHEASPTFPNRGVAFPVHQGFSTQVTYTVRPVCSVLPLKQGSQNITSSLPKYSSYASSVQYSQAYHPTATMQCSTPAHVDPLTGCASTTASTYTHCSFFQSPPVQSPCTDEFLPSDWPCNTSDENKEIELNLEAVFQMVDEMHSSPKAEIVQVEPVESQCSTPQSNRGQPLLVNSENSYIPSSTGESQLELLTPVAADTSFVMGEDQAVTCSPLLPSEFLCATHTTAFVESAAAEVVQESVTTQEAFENLREGADQAVTCSPLQPSEFLCATHTTAFVESAAAEVVQESVTTQEAFENLREGADQAVTCSPLQPSEFLCATHTTAFVESAAAEIVQESVTTQEACEKLREQLDHCPTLSSLMFVQEGPFSSEQISICR